jgi:hypothetical protein
MLSIIYASERRRRAAGITASAMAPAFEPGRSNPGL